jgi:outer membrane protein
MLARFLAMFAALVALGPAAEAAELKIASVDFQRALNTVNDAASVRSRLEGMYGERKAAIEKMKTQLDQAKAELDKQSVILSDSAKRQKEEEFQRKAMEFQSTYSRYEGEMQQAYYGAMEQYIEKLKKIATAVGQERSYTLVLEVTEGGVVYVSPTIDITDEVIKRYNAANPAPSAPAPKK